jgi:hypothetical protein
MATQSQYRRAGAIAQPGLCKTVLRRLRQIHRDKDASSFASPNLNFVRIDLRDHEAGFYQ